MKYNKQKKTFIVYDKSQKLAKDDIIQYVACLNIYKFVKQALCHFDNFLFLRFN